VPRALVTGATGQAGSYIVERLMADGWSTRALVRTPAAAEWLAREGVELSHGDVLDAATFAAAAEGCDAIFHAAAVVTARGGWESYRDANVGGTQNAVAAAEASGARLVHISSVAVYGGDSRYGERPTDESTPLAPLPREAFYARSKRESERLVLDAHESGRIWATAVRPDVIYGRHDRQFVPRLARVLERGFFPVLGGGGSTLAVVHASSVADGAVRAVAIDAAGGNCYNLANDFPVTVAEFARLGGQGLGRRVRLVSLPTSLARLALAMARGALRATGSGAIAAQSTGTLDFLSRDNPFTSDRARRELGWSPVTKPDVGVPDAFRWWKEHSSR